MAKSALSKIRRKGQVTIPKPIREALHLQPGDRVEWQIRPDGVIELRRRSEELDGLIGILGTPQRRLSLEEMDAALKARGESGRL